MELLLCEETLTHHATPSYSLHNVLHSPSTGLVGVSAASPTLVKKENCVYIHYGMCVFRIHIRFVGDATFPHCTLVDVATLAQETRLAGQKGLNGENQCNRDLKTVREGETQLVRLRLAINSVLHDSAANGECSVYSCEKFESERPA